MENAKAAAAKMRAGMAKAGAKMAAGMAKVGAKIKSGLNLKVKVGTKKSSSGAKYTIGPLGWTLNAGQNLKPLDGSFSDYINAKQAGAWTGKVTEACTNSPMMKKWVAKLILSEQPDDIAFSKWFWSGAQQLDAAI